MTPVYLQCDAGLRGNAPDRVTRRPTSDVAWATLHQGWAGEVKLPRGPVARRPGEPGVIIAPLHEVVASHPVCGRSLGNPPEGHQKRGRLPEPGEGTERMLRRARSGESPRRA